MTAAGVSACSVSGWLGALAADTAAHPQRKRSCILLWMSGGPSQLDTFDLKPDHANGGPFKPIPTSVPGVQISEHFPKIAPFADRMAIVRSLTSKEGDHGRATYLLRTGYLPQGPIQYPSIGALVSRELGEEQSELPNFVSVAPFRILNQGAFGSGFLGPRHDPLVVGETAAAGQQGQNADRALRVEDLAPTAGVSPDQVGARIGLLQQAQRDFLADHPDLPAVTHQNAYDRAVRLMRTTAKQAFDLDEEKATVRDGYGRNLFGQGCLLARRLVERQVPFVEVTLNGWDTHGGNAGTVRNLSQTVDAAWSSLMQDLKERGLLETTLIVWMGEFGRTPKFPRPDGRDHWPNSFSAVLAGGGIKGGQVIGDTGPDGAGIKDRPVTVPEFLATICQALGIDHQKQNLSNVGRPIRIVAPGTQAVKEALF
jgi:arylsulfatase A-like enzyme